MSRCVSVFSTSTHRVHHWPVLGVVAASLEGEGKGFSAHPEIFDLSRGILGGRLKFTALAKAPSKNQIDDSKELSKTRSTQFTVDKLWFFRDKGLCHTVATILSTQRSSLSHFQTQNFLQTLLLRSFS